VPTKMILPAFGAHTSGPLLEERVTLRLPPGSITPRGVNLDFTSLLLVDRVIVDRAMLEHLETHRIPAFEEFRTATKILQDKDFLEAKDFAQVFRENRETIDSAVEEALVAPERWLPKLRESGAMWAGYQGTLQQALGKNYHDWIRHEYGVLMCLRKAGDPITDDRIKALTRLIQKPKKNFSANERQALQEIVRPYLEYAYLNAILQRDEGIPFFEWDSNGPFYSYIYKTSLQPPKESSDGLRRSVSKAHDLFRFSFPEFQPRSATQLISILQDKRLASFRRRIEQALQRNEVFDEAFGRRVLVEIARENRSVDGSKKFGMAIGIAAELATDLLTHIHGAGTVAGVATHQIVDRLADARRDSYDWLYCLMSNDAIAA
jgi:hypothetical protein